MEKNSRIYVAGHRGLVGSAIVRNLEANGFTNIITRTHAELDLTNQADVRKFFEEENPEYVFLAAAKVGGIHANNTYPADFIYDNLKSMPCSVYEMNKILGNLIQNAIDELKEKNENNPKIDVDISKERGSIIVKVTNSTSLLENEIKNIFKVGYTTKRQHEGLGLPMVQKILNKYNGIIYSEILDKEISFIVRIPIA